MKQRLIDLLAMSRFANLPTVWSNVLVGSFLALFFNDDFFLKAFGFCLPVSCLYLGGCFFNDWHDSAFDAKHRPERAIPSGRWKRSQILGLALAFMSVGAASSFLWSPAAGVTTLLIVGCILIYTRWHKTKSISLLFMAGARALIYPASFLAFTPLSKIFPEPSTSLLLAIMALTTMGIYILGISLTAKAENRDHEKSITTQIAGMFCLYLPLLLHTAILLFVAPLADHPKAIFPYILFLSLLTLTTFQLKKNRNIGQFVSRTLAMIPLVDFLLVGQLFYWMQSLSHDYLARPEDWLLFWVFPLLSLMAWGLQKIAPAT